MNKYWWPTVIFTDGTNDYLGREMTETPHRLEALRQFIERGSADHYWVGYGFEIQDDTEEAEYYGKPDTNEIDWEGVDDFVY